MKHKIIFVLTAFAGLVWGSCSLIRYCDNGTGEEVSDEVGLHELKEYVLQHHMKIDDFQQPTVWAQLSKEARSDPRGECVTLCYITKEHINPRHIFLVYISPRRGIIDRESLIEDRPEKVGADFLHEDSNED